MLHSSLRPASARRPIATVILVSALALSPAAPARGQQPSAAEAPRFELTITNIMRGPETYGREPQQVGWSADGRWIHFQWNEPGTDWREPLRPYRVRAVAGARPERLSDAALDTLGPGVAQGDLSADRRRRVVAWQGDLYVVELGRGTVRRLTQTVSGESHPTFSRDGARVFFIRDTNAFALDLATGFVRQLTDIRNGPAPKDSAAATGERGFLEREQRALLGTIRDELRADSIEKADRKAREARGLAPLYLQPGERVGSLSVSPSGDAAILVTTTPAGNQARRTIVPRYVTPTGFTEDIDGRTKVGDAQSTGRIALLRIPAGTTTWLRMPGDSAARTSFAFVPGWNDAGTTALLWAAGEDRKTRWVLAIDRDGRATPVETLRDSAWVAIGGSGSNLPCFTCAGWLPDGRAWWISEASGFAHLYTANPDGSDRRQLTSGRWEVLDAARSADGRSFWLRTSERSPFEMHLYRMPVTGGARERITTRPGGHLTTLSPDGSLIADVYSEANRPPELFVMPARAGAPMAQLTTSPTAAWLAFPWITPAIVEIPASDGVTVPARIYRPGDLGAQPNGAAVIFVHGAGYLHNVHDYWSPYAREYGFNHLLASKGYVVLDVDYRGSGGYGRDWRTAVYRWMGGRDLQDHVDASRWLQREMHIDPERIGIYGGSYGGFMTLMALFTEPTHFGAGAALRSVTDWAHYNHGYTSSILNLPQDDSVAYRRSSPIYFAAGLEDPLLMAHGMVDVNVHFQDIVRLTQRLIELGKTDWWLAPYPVEDHAFVRPDSWTDEYRRIFELFETTIRTGKK